MAFTALLPTEHLEPPSSADSTGMKSLYLLHGYAGSNTDWIHFSRIRELSDQYNAIRNGLKYPENFGRIIGLSSALILHGIAGIAPDFHNGIAGYSYYRRVFGDLNRLLGSDKDPEALIKKLKQANADIPEIYLACGIDDFLLKENRLFHVYLVSEGIAHTYKESPGAHNWDFWNRHIAEALKWAEGY